MQKHRLIILICLLLLGCLKPSNAEINLFSRYRQGQTVPKVQLAPLQQTGRLIDGKRYLTEREAIELALLNNLDINVERHTRLERTLDIDLNRAFYDPVTQFGFTWDRDTTPTASVLQGGPSVTDILTDYNFAYRHSFRTGSTFEVNFLGNRNRTTNFFSSLVPAIQTQFEVLFRQDLLEGFGKAGAEYDIEISLNDREISEQAFKRIATDIIAQVQDQFWELEFSLKDIEVKQKSLELAQTVLEQNQARFEVGTASRLEVVQAEAEVAARNEELITARFSYRRVQDQLVKLISNYSDPRQFSGEIVPADTFRDLNEPTGEFEELLAISTEVRPEIQEEDLNIANRQIELERSQDQLKPALEVVVGYQQYGLGGTEIIRDFSQGFLNPPIVEVNPGGLGGALTQLFSSDFYGYLLGFNFELPLKNSDARTRNAKAQIAVDRAKLAKQAVKQAVGLEIRDTLTLIEMNHARLEAAGTAVLAAQERLRGEQARFEVGMGTTRELIEAQRDLLQAESVEVRARTDLIKSYNLLDKAVGRTFERQQIILQEALNTNVR